jgi:pimeloyl-ACP methyl ester carboxylesterase
MKVFDDNSEVRYLVRPEGKIAYELSGSGPLIVCVPGMGDLRATYRFLAPLLVAAGYRVAVTELRGHGDSDATFTTYGDEATATDIEALIWELGGPALVVGNSMGAASAILAAAHQPELIRGLALLGPWAREGKISAVLSLIMRVAMMPAWAAMSWNSYLPKLYAGTKPADFAQYRKAVVDSIKKPGYAKAFSLTTHTSHDVAEKALPDVATPVLVVMGEQDPDFKDPAGEARWICEQLGGALVMVPDSGHYPQSQRPELVGPAILAFADKVSPVNKDA